MIISAWQNSDSNNEDLFEMNEIPQCEEVWMIINSKLKLYSIYGEEI
ncbi:TPA: hypothetical protein MXT37_003087 [Clostridioides difficile]|nr:hypothetical protein [Clostridioides difficile]EJA6645308.1 hypothetical protein [Clostridioides difficile]EJA6792951.1 hypothetical protein [Clostridioides difficile]EQE50976.1 hypothetical protein QCG_4143 [Clostridioides difficile CD43]MBJ8596113.1 hypothetical protein [Clostridioides difficile]MBY1232324.1 hypothetical protein [Clostridioides difficile]